MARKGVTPSNGNACVLYNTNVTAIGDAGSAGTIAGAGFGDPANSANVLHTGSGVTYPIVPNCAHADPNANICWQYAGTQN